MIYDSDYIYKLLDYNTLITLDAIWKELVTESVHNSISMQTTGITEDWDFIEHTPFTEPFWGVIVNL